MPLGLVCENMRKGDTFSYFHRQGKEEKDKTVLRDMRHRKCGARALEEGRRVVCRLRKGLGHIALVLAELVRLGARACTQRAVRTAAARHLGICPLCLLAVLAALQHQKTTAQGACQPPGRGKLNGNGLAA